TTNKVRGNSFSFFQKKITNISKKNYQTIIHTTIINSHVHQTVINLGSIHNDNSDRLWTTSIVPNVHHPSYIEEKSMA
ncbi:hypothetical protein GIB67_020645, partial [Kingdonia uniflora]